VGKTKNPVELKEGYVINPDSKKQIKIDGEVFNKLLKIDYDFDKEAGVLVKATRKPGENIKISDTSEWKEQGKKKREESKKNKEEKKLLSDMKKIEKEIVKKEKEREKEEKKKKGKEAKEGYVENPKSKRQIKINVDGATFKKLFKVGYKYNEETNTWTSPNEASSSDESKERASLLQLDSELKEDITESKEEKKESKRRKVKRDRSYWNKSKLDQKRIRRKLLLRKKRRKKRKRR